MYIDTYILYIIDTKYICMKVNIMKDSIYKLLAHRLVSKNRGTPKWMVYNGKPY